MPLQIREVTAEIKLAWWFRVYILELLWLLRGSHLCLICGLLVWICGAFRAFSKALYTSTRAKPEFMRFAAVRNRAGGHGVAGSNPLGPTNRIKEIGQSSDWPFSFLP